MLMLVTVSMLYSLGVSQGRVLCLSQYYPKYSATTEVVVNYSAISIYWVTRSNVHKDPCFNYVWVITQHDDYLPSFI